jgi:hypothetical protein
MRSIGGGEQRRAVAALLQRVRDAVWRSGEGRVERGADPPDVLRRSSISWKQRGMPYVE